MSISLSSSVVFTGSVAAFPSCFGLRNTESDSKRSQSELGEMNVYDSQPDFSAVRLHFKAIALKANAQTKKECLPCGSFSQATLSLSLSLSSSLRAKCKIFQYFHIISPFFFPPPRARFEWQKPCTAFEAKGTRVSTNATHSPPPRSPFLSNTYVNTSSYSSASRTRHMKQFEADFFFFFHSNLLFTKGNRTPLSGEMEIISSFYATLQVSVRPDTKSEQVRTRRGVNTFLCVHTFENRLWE